jgi:hypothetical protein
MNNLIYFTIGNNKQYIQLLYLCLKSLQKVGYTGDYLIITDSSFKEVIKNIKIDNQIYFLEINSKDLKSSAGNKLKIYEFDNINQYEKILYCDVDMLWIKNPNIFFNCCVEDKIYIGEENPSSLANHMWGGSNHFTDEELEEIVKNDIKGMNAGLFLFKKEMVYCFQKIDEYYMNNQNLLGSCLEQPYINAYLFKNNIHDCSCATRKILQNSYKTPPNNLEEFDVIHFQGGPGNFFDKYNSMSNFFNTFYYN